MKDPHLSTDAQESTACRMDLLSLDNEHDSSDLEVLRPETLDPA